MNTEHERSNKAASGNGAVIHFGVFLPLAWVWAGREPPAECCQFGNMQDEELRKAV